MHRRSEAHAPAPGSAACGWAAMRGGGGAANMQNLGTALAKGGQLRQCRISGAHSSPAQWVLGRESPAPNLVKVDKSP
ncbi:MAG: hypothetical protein LBU32_08555 [Clostridiales bacterium]|nr:hypothetical protein [Clostridiales bacterium]